MATQAERIDTNELFIGGGWSSRPVEERVDTLMRRWRIHLVTGVQGAVFDRVIEVPRALIH